MEAAEHGHKATVEALLDKGADMNAEANNSDTALSLATDGSHTGYCYPAGSHPKLLKAATANDVSKVNEALTEGADKDAKDSAGWTALMWGAWNGNRDTVQALIDDGANLNALSNAGSTALKLATVKGHGAIVTLLKANGATGTPAAPTEDGKEAARNSLIIAVFSNNLSQLNKALEAGGDVNAKNGGLTVLMTASSNGRTAIVKALIEKGANVNSRTRAGKTALSYATRRGHTAIVTLLRNAGATR